MIGRITDVCGEPRTLDDDGELRGPVITCRVTAIVEGVDSKSGFRIVRRVLQVVRVRR